jgi:hypothetical protein
MNFALFLEIKARSAPDAPALSDRRHRLTLRARERDPPRGKKLRGRSSGADGAAIASLYLPNRAGCRSLCSAPSGVVRVPVSFRLVGPDLAHPGSLRAVLPGRPGGAGSTQPAPC